MSATDTDAHVSTCGCKGIRSCLLCERLKGGDQLNGNEAKVKLHFCYEPVLKLAVHEDGKPTSFPFPGVFIWEDFLSEEEEEVLVREMDKNVWSPSQSGRKKQDFGPKVNFKKRKVRLGDFQGLPAISKALVERMVREPVLAGFQPVEQCNLDYHPERGSSIDPHLDDSWLWGERLVTVNMLSDIVLTMSRHATRALELGLGSEDINDDEKEEEQEVQVAVRLPRRSLVVLYGEARHEWKHAIHREDVTARRLCSTYRELSAEFLPGGPQAEVGGRLLDVALSFSHTAG
ncbi:Alpha-ketoglutarate-dependent dioxygenase alkB 4 [Merluccius polli]|uniref:Alpha-ketoglutarate-dependent dioxygenase alkB 4 n=1 Tax=Merluccius polli TaxID=89951 RepID=A0AA47MZ60_MERPO|nr:Alpha-ketoglutarate-dependent dioxygenase alkB 4 [Merluccius polli]